MSIIKEKIFNIIYFLYDTIPFLHLYLGINKLFLYTNFYNILIT